MYSRAWCFAVGAYGWGLAAVCACLMYLIWACWACFTSAKIAYLLCTLRGACLPPRPPCRPPAPADLGPQPYVYTSKALLKRRRQWNDNDSETTTTTRSGRRRRQ